MAKTQKPETEENKDNRLILYIDQDGCLAGVYADMDIKVITLDARQGEADVIIGTDKPEPLSEILDENEMYLDDTGVVASTETKEYYLVIRSVSNGYEINLMSPEGALDLTRGFGDGVDQYFDKNEEALSPGSIAWQLAAQDDLDHNAADLLDAYFPNWKADLGLALEEAEERDDDQDELEF